MVLLGLGFGGGRIDDDQSLGFGVFIPFFAPSPPRFGKERYHKRFQQEQNKLADSPWDKQRSKLCSSSKKEVSMSKQGRG